MGIRSIEHVIKKTNRFKSWKYNKGDPYIAGGTGIINHHLSKEQREIENMVNNDDHIPDDIKQNIIKDAKHANVLHDRTRRESSKKKDKDRKNAIDIKRDA
ncbi:hypothetical protein BMW23_0024 [Bodo saltans virus]|uniref:Uncharacterized protein n=1 Tax=Bodo saltans virus TaxID=2024608 RepID=A0A2H4UTB0_9VIRU|nr:hypothetical protein QJ851_gp0023 [Bodo saltans virus]ATZ80086.1 hypothetical protein BMW23_0024 [Bodo saltans virus]